MYKSNFACLLLSVTLLLFSCKNEAPESLGSDKETPIAFNLPEGFVLETLYHPSQHEQGSWVALAEGPGNLFYACDQHGKIYSFKRPEIDQPLKEGDVTPLDLEIGEAHGLLWAFDALYVAVNKRWDDEIPDSEERASGVYRVTDSSGDGTLDQIDMLLKLEGEGEHGPHSFVIAPDGKNLYFIAGNHTLLPESVKKNSRVPNNWGEDNLFTPYLDARGHANDIKAPGGWIAKFDPQGDAWELISSGYRNPFDMAFNQDGELFAYDADMEWDIGMPWYRPTRICHVTSGSEYGWRTGSGKWPAYYPDNLPAVINLEQGSPTAVLSGAKLNFPARYRNGLLVMDWSFGTVYFIDLKEQGSSYTAEREEFLSGTPLPLTDMIAGSDGHLYFATGGRGLDSHFYRLRYSGEPAAVSEQPGDAAARDLRALRKEIEQYHALVDEKAVPLAWDNLSHTDRFIRYASRVALEHQPVTVWESRYFDEEDPVKLIEGGIAMAHQGDQKLQGRIIEKLDKIVWNSLSEPQQIDLLRTYSLLGIRMGNPDESHRKMVIRKLTPNFPNPSNDLTREIGQLLLFLRADGITEKLVELLLKHTREKTVINDQMLSEETSLRSEQYGPLIREVIEKMPPSEAIYYGVLLSHADFGWTPAQREEYFQWFFDVLSAKGGMSFKAGMENVRLTAMTHVPENMKEKFQELSGVYSPETSVAELPEPIGPGGSYSGSEMGDIVWGGLDTYNGTLADGERAYQAGMCVLCHRFRGEGGAAGPDLTQIHTKFNNYDLLFAIYSPNDEISDQYAFTLLHLDNEKKIAGKILSEAGDSITLSPNPFNTTYTVKVAKNQVVKRELSPVSPMPPGLLNRLNRQEIADLFAYLISGGDEKHELYTKKAEKEN